METQQFLILCLSHIFILVQVNTVNLVSNLANHKTNIHDGSSIFVRLSNKQKRFEDTSQDREDKQSSAKLDVTPMGALPMPSSSVTLLDPGLDARKEIATYNLFMDAIFLRMNAAIRAKNLDPMDLKLLSNSQAKASPRASDDASDTQRKGSTSTTTTTESILILSTPVTTTTTQKPHFSPIISDADDEALLEQNNVDTNANATVPKIRGWLYGMSTLKRSEDVSIFIRENYRTIQCPFSLGPLELKVSKTFGEGKSKRTKSATAKTDRMLGLMDLKIDRLSGQAEITNVFFDELGGVDLEGNLRRRVDTNKKTAKPSKYRLVLATKAALSIKKVARLVVATPSLIPNGPSKN